MDELTNEKINIESEEEVKYWSGTFGCTEADLVDSVLRVGDVPRVVELYLSLNRKINNQN